MFSQMARGLNAHGVTVAVAGYDLCPQVSIATIIEQMRSGLPVPVAQAAQAHLRLRPFRRRTSRRLHAGAPTGRRFASDAPADLVPAAYAISGVFDLAPLLHVSQNADLRLDDAEARRVSPLYLEGARRAHARRRGRRARIERVPAPEPGSSPTAGARAASRRATRKSPATNHFTVCRSADAIPTAR